MERQTNESQRRVINAERVLWAKALEGPDNSAQKFQREDVPAQGTQELGPGEW